MLQGHDQAVERRRRRFLLSRDGEQGDPSYGALEGGGAPRFACGPRCSPGPPGEKGGERSRSRGGGVLPAEGAKTGEWGGSWEERGVGPGLPKAGCCGLEGPAAPLGGAAATESLQWWCEGRAGNPSGPRQQQQHERPQVGLGTRVGGRQVSGKAVGRSGAGGQTKRRVAGKQGPAGLAAAAVSEGERQGGSGVGLMSGAGEQVAWGQDQSLSIGEEGFLEQFEGMGGEGLEPVKELSHILEWSDDSSQGGGDDRVQEVEGERGMDSPSGSEDGDPGELLAGSEPWEEEEVLAGPSTSSWTGRRRDGKAVRAKEVVTQSTSGPGFAPPSGWVSKGKRPGYALQHEGDKTPLRRPRISAPPIEEFIKKCVLGVHDGASKEKTAAKRTVTERPPLLQKGKTSGAVTQVGVAVETDGLKGERLFKGVYVADAWVGTDEVKEEVSQKSAGKEAEEGSGRSGEEFGPGKIGGKYKHLPYMGTAKPLGAHLMPATKEKIWKGEYVEMLKLLHREVRAKEGSKEEEYELAKRPRVPVTIENWTAAFLIYASVYYERHPEREVALFKYMDVIRKAYLNFGGYAWAQYDEEFRARMAADEEAQWAGCPLFIGPFEIAPPRVGPVAIAQVIKEREWQAQAQAGENLEHAGISTKGCAQGSTVNSSMNVPSAGESMPLPTASVVPAVGNSLRGQEAIPRGVRPSPSPGGRGLWEKAFTPVRMERLRYWASQYHMQEQGRLLMRGFSEGFELGYTGQRQRRWAENLRSVCGKEELVRLKLGKEVDEGRMEGPFSDWPLPNLIVSPIGVVPKKEPGQYRLIHHLSWPEGASVNDFITEDVTEVSYASVDVAMALVEALGQGTLMAKTDIKGVILTSAVKGPYRRSEVRQSAAAVNRHGHSDHQL
ncbi:hypothetical protein NDU88_012078 [Pleurodeles waltl]|uniref:Uncharacterized protein n=1 Tax=Pleurodeles waltl TaxID=8319 RepID=A0AAV7R0Z3_PLEWA|nr:hypothetical protein NDU88_012078 [Pleurodeles waltl]